MVVSEALVIVEIGRVIEREHPLHRKLRPSDRLVDDLGLDSLSLTTLAVELEDRYQVILSDDDATRVQTVAELAHCVAARMQASP